MLSPDAELKKTDQIVASSDIVVLDGCKRWANLAAEIIKQKLLSTIVIDLASNASWTLNSLTSFQAAMNAK